MDFEGEKAVVVGGASGIGRSTALTLAERGRDGVIAAQVKTSPDPFF